MKFRYSYLILVLLLFGCKEEFKVWKEFNESYLENQTAEKKFSIANNGLRYKIIFQGKGVTPKSSSIVKIHYKAELGDGTACTSIDTVDYVYNYPMGLQQAILQMPRESVWQLCIPYELGYGLSGTKNNYGNYIIPPYSTILVRELKILEVNP